MSTAIAEIGHNNEATALVRRGPVPGLIRPIARPDEMLKIQEEVRDLVAQTLKEGRDYGKIPGCGDKPAMLKPGAERCTMGFGCYARFRVAESEVDHDREVPWLKRKKKYASGQFTGWEEERGTSLGLYRYVVECQIVHRDSDSVIGSCLAACSTMESKYIDRPRDSENTVLKMAEKRAHVGAVLNAFGLSEQFTQDIEENPDLHARGAAADDGEEKAPCQKCGGAMWDNRGQNDEKLAKDPNAKLAPDWKCRDKACDGKFWRGQWPEKAAADRAARVRKMVEDIRALDERAGAEAEILAETVLQNPEVTEDEIMKVGGKLRGRLVKAQGKADSPPASEKPAAPANAERAPFPEELAPFGMVPSPVQAEDDWPTLDEDDDLPF